MSQPTSPQLAKDYGPKLTRALLGVLGGWGATYGVTLDDSNLTALVGSVALLFAVWAWSFKAKRQPSDTDRETMAHAAHAAAALLVPVIIGWMQAKGYTVTGETSIDVLGPLLLQVAASGLNKPDAPKK